LLVPVTAFEVGGVVVVVVNFFKAAKPLPMKPAKIPGLGFAFAAAEGVRLLTAVVVVALVEEELAGASSSSSSECGYVIVVVEVAVVVVVVVVVEVVEEGGCVDGCVGGGFK